MSNISIEERLRDLYRNEPQRDLKDRLLRIAEEGMEPPVYGRQSNTWRVAIPALLALVLVGALWFLPINKPVAPTEEQLLAQNAVRDFVIAMNYLQTSTAYANQEMQDQLGNKLLDVFDLSDQSFVPSNQDSNNGG